MRHFSKICTVLVTVAVFLSVISCAFAETASDAAVANPVHAASSDTVSSKFGVSMIAPTFANTVSWFTYDGSPEIVEMRFTVGEQEYCFRAAAAEQQTDISGMYFSWGPKSMVKVDDTDASACTASSGEGLILWYDAQNKLTYSLSVNSGATVEDLAKIASQIYTPVKPVVIEEPTGTVSGSVTYATNDTFGLSVNGVYYDFLINSDTVVECYYFDTGDYLTVTYSGYLGSQLTALSISKITVVVTPTPRPSSTPAPAPTYAPVPYYTPVPNPMISGEAYINSWNGNSCVLSNGVWLSVPDDIDMPAGYWPSEGDYVGYTYNSALMELRYVYCITPWQPDPEPDPSYFIDEPEPEPEPDPSYFIDDPEPEPDPSYFIGDTVTSSD